MSVEKDSLVDVYLDNYQCDISKYMDKNLVEVSLYQCLDSGFRFWWPNTIVGDGDFYKKLQEKDWYYKPDKWEFRESLKYIPLYNETSILEIGSARGDFLNLVHQHNPYAKLTGLELNQEAAADARRKGYDVFSRYLADHAKTNQSAYDVVASFQVLEHISKPMDFLRDALVMLKQGGTLIIGVPDNSKRAYPSIFIKPDADLNMPPHHQGLWDIPSLAFLTRVLPIHLGFIAVEPAIASNHSNSYRGLMKGDLIRHYGNILGIGIYALARPFYDHALKHLNKYLPAHTLLAVYRKYRT